MLYRDLRAKVMSLKFDKSDAERECARICGDRTSPPEACERAKAVRDTACDEYHLWHDIYLEKGE